MTRKIPLDKPLSDKDRAYLLMRGKNSQVAWFDQSQAAEEKAAEEVEEEETETEEVEDEYDEWTVAELQAELESRKLDKTGKKQELIDRLRADDAE